MAWTAQELEAISASAELQITTYRNDGTMRTFVPIWVVCDDADVFVRTWYRRDTGWFGRAVDSGFARVRAPGVDIDVVVEEVGALRRQAVDAAYLEKYASPGQTSVGGMTTDEATAATLRLMPRRRAHGTAE